MTVTFPVDSYTVSEYNSLVEDDDNKPYQPVNEDTMRGPELIQQVEDYSDRMWRVAQSEERRGDSLKINFSDLQELIDRHCYNLVATGCHLGQLKRKLEATNNKLNERYAELYKKSTDATLSGMKTGISKIDKEYRNADVYKDAIYKQLLRRKETLIESITVVESLYKAYEQKGNILNSMQKTNRV